MAVRGMLTMAMLVACSWVASWSEVSTDKPRYETFSAPQHGFEHAKELAIAARKAAEERGEARLVKRRSAPGSAAHHSDVKGGHLSLLRRLQSRKAGCNNGAQ
jgi:hypothetical protein